MTNPLQQAIERSRAASDWCTTEERVFREAAAIMVEALPDLIHWAKRGLEDIESVTASALLETAIARAEIAIAKANALFKEGEGVAVNASYDEDEVLRMCVDGVLTLDQTAELLGVSKDRFKAAIDKYKEAPRE